MNVREKDENSVDKKDNAKNTNFKCNICLPCDMGVLVEFGVIISSKTCWLFTSGTGSSVNPLSSFINLSQDRT